jgi:hypothetical protein
LRREFEGRHPAGFRDTCNTRPVCEFLSRHILGKFKAAPRENIASGSEGEIG